jgi:hypothetical protein
VGIRSEWNVFGYHAKKWQENPDENLSAVIAGKLQVDVITTPLLRNASAAAGDGVAKVYSPRRSHNAIIGY